MKTLATVLWVVILAAIFSTIFFVIGELLIDFGKWLIWRLRLQIKRLKETRRVEKSKNNLKPKTKL